MTEKQYPRVGYSHDGAHARWSDMYNGTNKTHKVALAEFEEKLGHSLTLAERREFLRGWRVGKANVAINDIQRLLKYLTADELDTLGEELYQLGRKWGVCRTEAEMRARLAESETDAHP